jgi:hypothetical protein
MGWVKDATGSFSGGLLLIAATVVLGVGVVFALGHDRELERTPAAMTE